MRRYDFDVIGASLVSVQCCHVKSALVVSCWNPPAWAGRDRCSGATDSSSEDISSSPDGKQFHHLLLPQAKCSCCGVFHVALVWLRAHSTRMLLTAPSMESCASCFCEVGGERSGVFSGSGHLLNISMVEQFLWHACIRSVCSIKQGLDVTRNGSPRLRGKRGLTADDGGYDISKRSTLYLGEVIPGLS